jgi:RNA polymerase sigma-70 factor (ECF subfamily)
MLLTLRLWLLLAVATLRGDDESQLAALQRGDPAAWSALLRAHLPALLAYARRMLGDAESAEEVVQDALVNVHLGLERFEGRCSIKSWLYRAVHNKAIDELRRRKRFVARPADEDDDWAQRFAGGHWVRPPREWEGSDGARIDAQRVLAIVAARIDSLPHQHREVLLMKEVQGLSSDEICDALGISAANLRVCLHRARRALRDAVAAELEAPNALP